MKSLTLITLFLYCFFTIIEARKIIVIRHGEKISDDYLGLNDKGTARANCLYKIFNEKTSFGKPTSIYSNKRGNRSHRPYDTVKPLADRYGITIKEFNKYEPEKFVKNTLNKDKANIILISSAREWIPSLLKAIGYKYNEEVEDFDNVWIINNDNKKGGGKLVVKKQNLEECINLQLGKSNVKKTTKKTTTKKTTTKKTTKKTTTKKTTLNKNQKNVKTKAAAVEHKKCGPGFKACPKGQCCSKYGYCGITKPYFGVGCQPKYGICH